MSDQQTFPGRTKYMDLEPGPDGRPRKRYMGLMTEEEYVMAIWEHNGAQNDPMSVDDLPDLDDGATPDNQDDVEEL